MENGILRFPIQLSHNCLNLCVLDLTRKLSGVVIELNHVETQLIKQIYLKIRYFAHCTDKTNILEDKKWIIFLKNTLLCCTWWRAVFATASCLHLRAISTSTFLKHSSNTDTHPFDISSKKLYVCVSWYPHLQVFRECSSHQYGHNKLDLVEDAKKVSRCEVSRQHTSDSQQIEDWVTAFYIIPHIRVYMNLWTMKLSVCRYDTYFIFWD